MIDAFYVTGLNKETSQALQLNAFANGWSWNGGETEPIHTNHPVLSFYYSKGTPPSIQHNKAIRTGHPGSVKSELTYEEAQTLLSYEEPFMVNCVSVQMQAYYLTLAYALGWEYGYGCESIGKALRLHSDESGFPVKVFGKGFAQNSLVVLGYNKVKHAPKGHVGLNALNTSLVLKHMQAYAIRHEAGLKYPKMNCLIDIEGKDTQDVKGLLLRAREAGIKGITDHPDLNAQAAATLFFQNGHMYLRQEVFQTVDEWETYKKDQDIAKSNVLKPDVHVSFEVFEGYIDALRAMEEDFHGVFVLGKGMADEEEQEEQQDKIPSAHGFYVEVGDDLQREKLLQAAFDAGWTTNTGQTDTWALTSSKLNFTFKKGAPYKSWGSKELGKTIKDKAVTGPGFEFESLVKVTYKDAMTYFEAEAESAGAPAKQGEKWPVGFYVETTSAPKIKKLLETAFKAGWQINSGSKDATIFASANKINFIYHKDTPYSSYGSKGDYDQKTLVDKAITGPAFTFKGLAKVTYDDALAYFEEEAAKTYPDFYVGNTDGPTGQMLLEKAIQAGWSWNSGSKSTINPGQQALYFVHKKGTKHGKDKFVLHDKTILGGVAQVEGAVEKSLSEAISYFEKEKAKNPPGFYVESNNDLALRLVLKRAIKAGWKWNSGGKSTNPEGTKLFFIYEQGVDVGGGYTNHGMCILGHAAEVEGVEKVDIADAMKLFEQGKKYGNSGVEKFKEALMKVPDEEEYEEPTLFDSIDPEPWPQKIEAMKKLLKASSPCHVPAFTAFRPYDPIELPKGDKLFVRPCPFVPNHGAAVAGFESKMVEKSEASSYIRKVQTAMRIKEPRAGILVMPYINARLSSVIAPNQYMAIGRGHDGITAGTSDQVVLPLMKESTNWIKKSGEDPERVELEMVYGQSSADIYQDGDVSYLVQLRRAEKHVDINPPPTKEARPGFVPGGERLIKHIYVVQDLEDLGELEQAEERWKEKGWDMDAVLVVQPTGSLLSHASAHCRGKGIPFVVGSHESYQEGQTLYDAGGWVTTEKVEGAAYDPADYQDQFWEGVERSRTQWERSWGRLSTFFHQYTSKPVGNPEKTAYLAGVFVGWLATAGNAAVMGELRHTMSQSYAPTKRKHEVQRFLQEVTGESITGSHSSRSKVYKALLSYAPRWDEIEAAMHYAMGIFQLKWSGSYGGKRWAECAANTKKVARAIEKEDLGELIQAANELENSSHNNGNLFSKHLQKAFFDYGTSGFLVSLSEYAFQAAEEAFKVLDGPDKPRPPAFKSWKEIIETLDTIKPEEKAYEYDEEGHEGKPIIAKAVLV